MTNKPRKYSICEPSIHEALDWDMELIMPCMELIRRKLPELLNINIEHLEFDLVSLENPFGAPYPVIGIHSPDGSNEKIPDFLDLVDIANAWVKETGLENLKNEAVKVKSVTWQELESAGYISFKSE